MSSDLSVTYVPGLFRSRALLAMIAQPERRGERRDGLLRHAAIKPHRVGERIVPLDESALALVQKQMVQTSPVGRPLATSASSA